MNWVACIARSMNMLDINSLEWTVNWSSVKFVLTIWLISELRSCISVVCYEYRFSLYIYRDLRAYEGSLVHGTNDFDYLIAWNHHDSFKSMLPKSVPPHVHAEPLCDSSFPVTMATMDHLTGVRHRDKIDYKGEAALEEALNSLIFDKEKIDTDQVALYLTYAMKQAMNRLILIAILKNCTEFPTSPPSPLKEFS